MTFNLAEYEATVARLDASAAQLDRLLQRVPAATASAAGAWYMTDNMSTMLTQASQRLVTLGFDLLAKIREFLKGVAAPVRFYFVARDWTEVRGVATSVAGNLQPVVLPVDAYWQGPASEAYKVVIPANAAAAVRIGAMADKTATALTWSAAAACAFYIGVLLVALHLIGTLIVGLIGIATGVLALPSVGAIMEAVFAGIVEIAALAALLVAALTTQGIQMTNLHSEAEDATSFPGGHWPPSVTERYLDATVADGDADWSLQR